MTWVYDMTPVMANRAGRQQRRKRARSEGCDADEDCPDAGPEEEGSAVQLLVGFASSHDTCSAAHWFQEVALAWRLASCLCKSVQDL